MKLYTPDNTILMDIEKLAPHEKGIIIEGKIMGTMPMKAILTPKELKAGLRFARPGLIGRLARMLLRRSER